MGNVPSSNVENTCEVRLLEPQGTAIPTGATINEVDDNHCSEFSGLIIGIIVISVLLVLCLIAGIMLKCRKKKVNVAPPITQIHVHQHQQPQVGMVMQQQQPAAMMMQPQQQMYPNQGMVMQPQQQMMQPQQQMYPQMQQQPAAMMMNQQMSTVPVVQMQATAVPM